ncbi:MAG: hypothetical protein JEZ12_03595 [Desulfobacterium sp.]|nr:hypothetical protein [Desulfobacterium sp.]
MVLRGLTFLTLIVIYILIFLSLNQSFPNRNINLERALPTKFQRVTSGYLKQLVSEIIFIKTSVFIGGVKPGTPETTYSGTLANNFEVMTSLYPEFIDPYYFCQSFLTPLSLESAQRANAILNKGIETFPDDFILRFFYAFNFYRYLNDPLKSAQAFKKASALPDAPPMFAHLAVLFSAEGGNIKAGLIMLKTMAAMEDNEKTLVKYQQEIDIFEKALVVENAISSYTKKRLSAPEKLEDLVPEFIDQLPKIENNFILKYEPPVLRLKRKES